MKNPAGVQVAGLAAALGVLALGLPARAQDAARSPLESATAHPADKPVTAIAAPPAAGEQTDAEVAKALAMLTGSFRAPGAGERPELRMHCAAVAVAGTAGTVLLEVARVDAPADPFQTAIVQVYRRRGELRLRTYDFKGPATYPAMLTGLWAAPEAVPALKLDQLIPTMDMALFPQGDGFRGSTPQPVPTVRAGAVEMTSTLVLTPTSVSMADAGFDAAGARVWGVSEDAPVVFERVGAGAGDVASVRRVEGMTIITLVEPPADAPRLKENGEIAAHYTGWLTTGVVFDSTRTAGREPFRIRLPGAVIRGWNEGLKDIAKGERRRLIIPASMGYGDRGAGRGLIPPGATLIFDVECVHVDNTVPTPPPPPPPTFTPAESAPKPEPAKSDAGGQPGDAPIGKPANNSQPERPR